jgi:hypothetical protein
LQQVQFQIGESIRTMNDNLGEGVSITNINNYAETNPNQVDIISSGYESTLFQYTAETFQVNNASMEDINQSFLASALNDTTRNIRKAFSGIFYNGLRDLRSASLKIGADVFDIYNKEIGDTFYLFLVIIPCIAIFIILLGTGLLIRTVFTVMRTTRLVITLFGMIENPDITILSNRCEKFAEDYLNEGEKKKAESEKDRYTQDNPAQTETVLAKTEVPGLVGNPSVLVQPVKKEHEEEPFDVKTEKPMLNGNQVHIVPEDDGKKNKDGKEQGGEKNKDQLLNNGEPVEDEKSYLKDGKGKKVPLHKDKTGKNKDKNAKSKGRKDQEDKRKEDNE